MQQTPLHAACGCGHEEAVEMLLAHPDIDVNAQDKVRGAVTVVRASGHLCTAPARALFRCVCKCVWGGGEAAGG